MSTYVDGFVLCIPQDKIAQYRELAQKAGKIWREHGALEYRECLADDMNAHDMVPFPTAAGAKEGEVVVFSYIVYKSRADRDAVNAKVMSDPRLSEACTGDVFDYKRMVYGGFETIVAE